jgi:hypothetical protein
MKQLIRLVMAAAFVVAMALPAMAKTWDVCLESADLNTSGEVTVAGISQPESLRPRLPSFRPAPSMLRPLPNL